MPIQTKVSGAFKSAVTSVRVGGAWKAATAYVRVGGAWKGALAQKVATPSVLSAVTYGAPDGMTFTFQVSTTGATLQVSADGTNWTDGNVISQPFGQTAYCRAYKAGWITSDTLSVN